MTRLVIYISGPLRGDLAHNITQASKAFRELAAEGFAPICPHWSCFSGQLYTTPTGGAVYAFATADGNGMSHREWLAIDTEIITRCDAVLRLPGESEGADLEVIHALSRGKPVFSTVGEIVRWRREVESVAVS